MTSYISTRGPGDPKSFLDVLLAGMAPDGGLYIPDQWPELDRKLLENLASGISYAELAAQIMTPFIGNALGPETLRDILADTYEGGSFDHRAVAPLTQIGPNAWILELFHGPTFSFKDYALQFLGRTFDYVLGQRGERLTIIGATSGDTGSAAIEACRQCENIDIFILYPQGRTSDVQRRQMTTVDAPNVHTIAIEGHFDDCQALVKAMFADEKLRGDLNLSAVNSINWVRIMAQIVYYVAAALALGAPHRPVSFAVPTGNFGNVYAAWVARRIGLPINRLIIGTNRNDIITRFFESGTMSIESVTPSLSPSMDIQISSNFERYLCDLMGRNHASLRVLMQAFATRKSMSVEADLLDKARSEFQAYRCSDEQTLEMIGTCYRETGEIIDPHTAVALHAAMQAMEEDPSVPVVSLACAHPAKFPAAVKDAIGVTPAVPGKLAAIMEKPEFFTVLPNDLERVKSFIRQNARQN